MRECNFLRCKHCGNLVAMIHQSGVPVICCGEPMEELRANTVEASREKHIPVVSQDQHKVTITVGSIDHPMLQEHYIEWICLEKEMGFELKYLEPGQPPKVVFEFGEDNLIAVYAYCNLHGLWKKEI